MKSKNRNSHSLYSRDNPSILHRNLRASEIEEEIIKNLYMRLGIPYLPNKRKLILWILFNVISFSVSISLCVFLMILLVVSDLNFLQGCFLFPMALLFMALTNVIGKNLFFKARRIKQNQIINQYRKLIDDGYEREAIVTSVGWDRYSHKCTISYTFTDEEIKDNYYVTRIINYKIQPGSTLAVLYLNEVIHAPL